MKNAVLCLVLMLVAFSVSGCLFSSVTMPLDTDAAQTKIGPGLKKGEASAYSVLWLAAWGDMGTKAAADNGGMTKVHHMDQHHFQVFFGLFTKHTTVVYGE